VLEGEAEFLAGDVREVASAGTLVFIPRGSIHAFRVRSEMPACLICKRKLASSG
jgi:quercetin dioxygenase-like cupin family protein